MRERDLGGAIREAQQKIAAQIQLPPGSRLEWVGEYGNLQDAIKRLSIVVPISLALIAILLWFNFGSIVEILLDNAIVIAGRQRIDLPQQSGPQEGPRLTY